MDQAEQLRNVIKKKSREASAGCARVLTITSGKGGVGKSNVAVNMAVWLRRMERKVIIIDADLGLANVEVMFGAVPQYNLSDLIYRGKSIREIITKGPMDIGFISGGLGIAGLNNLSKDQIVYLVHSLAELNEMADVIIIDTGAGISDSVIEFLLSSEEILLVTTPEPTSITDSYALLKTLNTRAGEESGDIIVKLVANRVSGAAEAKNLYSKLSVVVHKFLKLKLEYLGMVPRDTNMSKSIMQQKPVSIAYPDSEGARAIARIAENLLGKKRTKEEDDGEKKGIATAIMKMFRNRKN